MQLTKTSRVLLVLSSIVAVLIGTSILFAPASFHASNGIEFATDASTLSEVRAPGGALLALGALMLVGLFVKAFAVTSLSVAAAVYLAYGVSRVIGLAIDGIPADGLVVATLIELALGSSALIALIRMARRASATQQSTEAPEAPAVEIA